MGRVFALSLQNVWMTVWRGGETHAGACFYIVGRDLWHEMCLCIVTSHCIVGHLSAFCYDSVLSEKSPDFAFVSARRVSAILYAVR